MVKTYLKPFIADPFFIAETLTGRNIAHEKEVEDSECWSHLCETGASVPCESTWCAATTCLPLLLTA